MPRSGPEETGLPEDPEEYDFALELRRDAQYRLVAERQPPGLAEDNCESPRDIECGPSPEEEAPAESFVEFIMSAEDRCSEDGQEPDLDDPDPDLAEESRSNDSLVSIGEYVTAVRALRQRQRRATTAARRSTAAFTEKYVCSDSEALNKLLYALGAGVHVRRHQAGFRSEEVRLFSLSGGRSVHWAPQAVRPVGRLARLDSMRTGAQFVRGQARDSGLDCCIASELTAAPYTLLTSLVCGCGDDLLEGEDGVSKVVSAVGSNRRGWFTAFQSKGSFE